MAETDTYRLTRRQVRLIWEVLTSHDVDVLNDNLARLANVPLTDVDELSEIAAYLDPDGVFEKEWQDASVRGVWTEEEY